MTISLGNPAQRLASAAAKFDVALVSPEGKIIVTIETEGDRETIARYEYISQIEGVMSASMVYHQQENEPEVEISLAA